MSVVKGEISKITLLLKTLKIWHLNHVPHPAVMWKHGAGCSQTNAHISLRRPLEIATAKGFSFDHIRTEESAAQAWFGIMNIIDAGLFECMF